MDVLVSLWEFKTGTGKSEIETLCGQQVERCRAVLDSCDDRQFVVAVNVTMNTLEIITAERQPGNDLRLRHNRSSAFSISKDSLGFQLLFRLLLTPMANLGYVTPLMPMIESLGQHRLEVLCFLKQGSAHQGSGSWVFLLKLGPDGGQMGTQMGMSF